MAVKGIKVLSCSVYYPEGSDSPVFTNTRIEVQGKIKEGKCEAEHSVKYTLDLEGLPVSEAAEKSAAAWRIDVAKLREKGDEAVRAIDGRTIHVLSIASMTASEGGDPLLRALKAMGMTEEQAKAICENPKKREKAQVLVKSLLAKDEDDE